jgi:hypothetical protein
MRYLYHVWVEVDDRDCELNDMLRECQEQYPRSERSRNVERIVRNEIRSNLESLSWIDGVVIPKGQEDTQ